MYLNHNAKLQCTHGGQVVMMPPPMRSFNIMHSPVITDMDLYQAMIVGCAQISPVTVPCTMIVAILMGEALQIQVDGEIPILDSLQALTNGVPPGLVSALYDGGSNATPAPLSIQSATMAKAARTGTPLCPVCPCRQPVADGLEQQGNHNLRNAAAAGQPPAARDQSARQRLVGAQDAARSNPAFQRSPGGVTHCNQATVAIAQAAGAPMGPLVDSDGHALLANTQAANLATSPDYHQLTPEQAQQAANNGDFVVAAYDNPGGHGHVATVRPEDVAGDHPVGRSGPLLNDIGANDRIDHQSAAFRSSAVVRYYSPNPTQP